ncbi:MAG: hypothetical protein JNL08_16215, partial [Planctomycetes bacterium]|nr:hypothetical protein [Planctomycetota bacterium]
VAATGAGAAAPAAVPPVGVARSLVAPPSAPRAGVVGAMRAESGTVPEPLLAAPPGTALVRAGTATAAVGPVRAAAVPRARSRPVAAAPTLRDPLAAAARARAAAAAAPAARAVPPIASVADPSAPRPTDVRARRSATVGNDGPAVPRARPPASQLERVRAPTVAAAATIADAAPTPYSNRFGPAKARALAEFGGSAETERAVADGLRYLARQQAADGTWGDRRDFDPKYGHVYVGKTALCVLAFLGAGHTPESRTEHSAVVARAIDHLLSLQDEDTGAFGASSCYGHGISTYAIAECYGLTKSPRLLQPLERALTWILDHQGPRRDRRNRGGWGYFSPGLEAEDNYARVSVSAWMVMALESARLSGIELPPAVLPRAREYLEASFDSRQGWFRYNHEPGRLASAWPTLPASTPAGAFCLMLLGVGADDAKVQAAVDYTVERRPREYRPYDDDAFVLQGQGNVYFWYYGSLCCFLAGGEAWTRWNERLRTLLPAAQAPDGSFAPIDVYAQEAGDNRRDRSYTTAMCVLSLEVYYRYFTPLLLGR